MPPIPNPLENGLKQQMTKGCADYLSDQCICSFYTNFDDEKIEINIEGYL